MSFDLGGVYRKSQEIRQQLDDCTNQLERLVIDLRREVDRLAEVPPVSNQENRDDRHTRGAVS